MPLSEINQLNSSNAICFLKANKGIVLCEKEVDNLLNLCQNDFCLAFYLLSDSNRVILEKTFRKSFLRQNLKNFSDEELYFLYEGIRNQIRLKFDDFYLLFHHFLIHLNKKPFQSLIISIISEFDYKFNEIIITNDLLSKIMENSAKPSVFQLKFLKWISEVRNPSIERYIKSLNLNFNFGDVTGCKTYFKQWYEKLRSRSIVIRF